MELFRTKSERTYPKVSILEAQLMGTGSDHGTFVLLKDIQVKLTV
jgi:hypothetical protein